MTTTDLEKHISLVRDLNNRIAEAVKDFIKANPRAPRKVGHYVFMRLFAASLVSDKVIDDPHAFLDDIFPKIHDTITLLQRKDAAQN